MTVSGAQLIAEVEKLAAAAGERYVYGGTTSAGYDCSGLIYAALIALGYTNVPRTSEEQYGWVKHISQDQLAPGDLVFAQFPGDNAPPGHVGIYIGNGEIFSAEDPAQGIGISTLQSWQGNLVGFGQIPASTETAGADTSDVTSGGSSGIIGDIESILGLTAATSFATDIGKLISGLMWIVTPGAWLRIGAFFVAIILLIGAIIIFTKADTKINVQPVPVPV